MHQFVFIAITQMAIVLAILTHGLTHTYEDGFSISKLFTILETIKYLTLKSMQFECIDFSIYFYTLESKFKVVSRYMSEFAQPCNNWLWLINNNIKCSVSLIDQQRYDPLPLLLFACIFDNLKGVSISGGAGHRAGASFRFASTCYINALPVEITQSRTGLTKLFQKAHHHTVGQLNVADVTRRRRHGCLVCKSEPPTSQRE